MLFLVSVAQIIQEENDPMVLRMLLRWAIDEVEKAHQKINYLEKLEAAKKQVELDLAYNREMFKKLVFGRGSEKRSADRDRRFKPDKTPLLHSQSLLPPPSPEEIKSLDEHAIYHEMSAGQLKQESQDRGLKTTCWEEIKGLTEDATEVTVTERRYILEKHKRKMYRYQPAQDETLDKEVIVTAPGPEKLLPGASYSIDFALTVVRDKYENHIPLERQSREMEQLGLKGVGTKTLYNLCLGAATHLEPVAEKIRKDIFTAPLAVHADETTWPILERHADDGYMWIVSNQAGAYYRFEPTRSGKIAQELFKDYDGVVLTDGYAGYNRLKRAKIKVAHCWAHARRKFVDIENLYEQEVKGIIDKMGRLFALEHEAGNFKELATLRKEKSAIVTDEIKAWLIDMKTKHLPESVFTKAVNYTLKHWDGLTAFLKDMRIPLTNNDAERGIQHAVMGRKNFYGSKTINGADVAATLYTVIESCKRVELDVTTFIREIIRRNNHDEEITTPLKYATEIRKPAAA